MGKLPGGSKSAGWINQVGAPLAASASFSTTGSFRSGMQSLLASLGAETSSGAEALLAEAKMPQFGLTKGSAQTDTALTGALAQAASLSSNLATASSVAENPTASSKTVESKLSASLSMPALADDALNLKLSAAKSSSSASSEESNSSTRSSSTAKPAKTESASAVIVAAQPTTGLPTNMNVAAPIAVPIAAPSLSVPVTPVASSTSSLASVADLANIASTVEASVASELSASTMAVTNQAQVASVASPRSEARTTQTNPTPSFDSSGANSVAEVATASNGPVVAQEPLTTTPQLSSTAMVSVPVSVQSSAATQAVPTDASRAATMPSSAETNRSARTISSSVPISPSPVVASSVAAEKQVGLASATPQTDPAIQDQTKVQSAQPSFESNPITTNAATASLYPSIPAQTIAIATTDETKTEQAVGDSTVPAPTLPDLTSAAVPSIQDATLPSKPAGTESQSVAASESLDIDAAASQPVEAVATVDSAAIAQKQTSATQALPRSASTLPLSSATSSSIQSNVLPDPDRAKPTQPVAGSTHAAAHRGGLQNTAPTVAARGAITGGVPTAISSTTSTGMSTGTSATASSARSNAQNDAQPVAQPLVTSGSPALAITAAPVGNDISAPDIVSDGLNEIVSSSAASSVTGKSAASGRNAIQSATRPVAGSVEHRNPLTGALSVEAAPVTPAHVSAVTDASALMRDPSAARSALLQTGASGGASASAATPGSRDPIAELDAQGASITPTWVHAGAQHAEAGYEDPNLGWVGVRADLSTGSVHASVVPGSADAAQVLGTQMAGLNSYLNEHRSPVDTVTLSAPEGRTIGNATDQGGGMQQGSGQHTGQNAAQDAGQGSSSAPQSIASVSTRASAVAAPVQASTSTSADQSAEINSTGVHISVVA